MNDKLFFIEDGHKYIFNSKDVPSVSRILLDEGFISTQWFTDAGRERGSVVHKAVADQCHGAHCMMKAEHAPYLTAFSNFRRDCDWRPKIIETPMGCRQYAGTPDQIGTLNGLLAVLDVKTGVISRATGLQLTAYEKLYNIRLAEDQLAHPVLPIPMRRFALQLTGEGRYILTEYKDRMDRYIWDSAVAIWWFKKNNIRK